MLLLSCIFCHATAFKAVIAEELANALARQPQQIRAVTVPFEANDAEAKYGARLDKMMNELTKPTSRGDTESNTGGIPS